MKGKAVIPVLSLLLAAGASAQMRPTRGFLVTSEQVSLALERHLGAGLGLAPEGVRLLGRVLSTSREPELHVLSVEPLLSPVPSALPAAPRYAVRFACGSTEECLPFYAIVRGSPAIGSSLAVTKAGGSGRPGPQKAAPFVLRAGSRATLQLLGTGAAVTMTVICLEDAVAGQVIRVRNPANQAVLRARAVDGQLLRGGF